MVLGLPRGFFYYDYLMFIRTLLHGSGIKILEGKENNEETLALGSRFTVDEACLPIKLAAGQAMDLAGRSDRVLIPRVMKDYSGRWLCPKLLGLPELVEGAAPKEKLLVTAPLYFNDEKKLKKALWAACSSLGMNRRRFETNFRKAYSHHRGMAEGAASLHVEAGWEFMPQPPKDGEIILPNTKNVLLLGHPYLVYDPFANMNIMKKLDELGIEAVTEKEAGHRDREHAITRLRLAKKPFWEALIRTLGSALCLRQEADGIVYLSSFSCGPDAVILELLKAYVPDLPLLVLKLDEHRGEAGLETRVEAFADLLEKRRAS